MEILFDESTKKALLQKLEEENKSAVRFVIAGIGWGGPKIGIVLDEQKKYDFVYIVDEVKFVKSNSYSNLVGKFIVNYRRNLSGNFFTVSRA